MKNILGVLLVLMSLSLIPGFAVAGYTEGVVAFNKDDYATALKEFMPLADQGNASAQFYLGVMHDIGRGLPQDDKEAAKWYRLAADQGNASAQDYKEAVRWYRLAADQGDAFAQICLGFMYANDLGVRRSKIMAYALWNISAVNDPFGENRSKKNRTEIASSMSQSEIEEGQALSREMTKPGNILKALDAYVAKKESKPHPKK